MAVSNTSSASVGSGFAVDRTNLERIESYFNTSSYRENLEVSATFNSRLSLERRLRLPFLDPQTGIAQRHCALHVNAKQRIPGLRSGQLYSFPATRWRKSKRQYLTHMMTDFEAAISHQQQQREQQPLSSPLCSSGGGSQSSLLAHSSSSTMGATSGGFLLSQHDENSNSNASFLLDKSLQGVGEGLLEGSVDTNSRDTNNNSKDELSKDWLYDELENEFDSEPKSPDDEFDYDPRYGIKKKKKAPKKEAKGKKSSAFGFDFSDSRSGSTTPKTRRTKDPSATSGKKAASGDGTERRTRRKGAGAKGKKLAEPPSFESAAAGFDDLSFGSSASGWM